jgi:hypothetical protein
MPVAFAGREKLVDRRRHINACLRECGQTVQKICESLNHGGHTDSKRGKAVDLISGRLVLERTIASMIIVAFKLPFPTPCSCILCRVVSLRPFAAYRSAI